MLRSRPWWVLHGAGLCLSFIRIGLSHCCITGLASLSRGLCLLVVLCFVMSRRSPRPSLMYWGCTSTLSLVVNWLTGSACVMPWSWVPSIGEWLIDASCDSPLAWYFVSHDGLVLYLLRLTLVCYCTTNPSSYCTRFAVLWLLDVVVHVRHHSYYLLYLGHGTTDSRCYLLGRCGL